MANAKYNSRTRQTHSFDFAVLNTYLCLACQVFLLVVLGLGGFSSISDKVSVVGAVRKIKTVFSFHGSLWYYYLSSAAHGILYFVIAIAMIRSLVTSLKSLKHYDSNQRMYDVRRAFHNQFKQAVLYVIIISLLAPTRLTLLGLIALIVGVVIITTGRLFAGLAASPSLSWVYLTTETIYLLLRGMLLLIFGGFVLRACVPNILNGLGVLFRSIDGNGDNVLYKVYHVIGIDIFHLIMTIFMYMLIDTTLYSPLDVLDRKWRRLLITATAYVLVGFILFLIASNGGEFAFMDRIRSYFLTARVYTLPLLFIAGAGYISCSCPTFSK